MHFNMTKSILMFIFIILSNRLIKVHGVDNDKFGKVRFDEELELMVTPGNVTKKLIPGTQPVKLNCINKSWNFSGGNVTWFYKACGPGTNIQLCDSSKIRTVEDVPMCGVSNLQLCSLRLTLDRPKSGLYKCYHMEKKAGYVITASLVNTFQLEVLDRSMKAPEFDQGPEDQLATVGSAATFTCTVRSALPLHVNWYKQVEKLYSKNTIQYEKKFFQSLNVTEVSIKGNLQSQLRLKKISMKDAGTYACGAINEAGIRYREAKLIVKALNNGNTPLQGKQSNYDEWKWAIGASALVLLILLIKCLFCWKILKQAFAVEEQSTSSDFADNRRLRSQTRNNKIKQKKIELQSETANETSDYEQVFTL